MHVKSFSSLTSILALAFGLVCQMPAAEPDKPLDPEHAAKMTRGLDLFKKSVGPLLTTRCVRCHGGKSTEAGLDLTDRERLLKGGDAGPAILPGKGKDSLLIKLVSHAREPHMPQGSPPLSEEAINHLRAWIDNLAPYDGSLKPQTTASPSWTTKVVPTEARKHWAFQPLKAISTPSVKDEAWSRNPIDRFILARLEATGIKPNPTADPRTLIRRAYLDLVGLPPPPDKVEAFVQDYSARPRAAYEKVVGELLGSRHFGERWARHWLDLARFAESHGFEHDYDRPTAYHYRDFVIQAFNKDLPYDTFVKWQLAGDEYEPNDNLALTATGFLAAGVHPTQITKNEVAKHRYDEMDDMLTTIGTSMLGLTIGCARCHDHKYDAIPQADYYRMLSTFTTTIRSEVDLDTDREGFLKSKALFDSEHAPLVKALARFDEDQLPKHLASAEKAGTLKAETVPWVIADVIDPKSTGGATFNRQADGSLLATGKNARFDTYTFTIRTQLVNITALRLEALSDPSLVKGGPGRAANGNFALTDLKISAAATGEKPVSLNLKNPCATFEQKGLPVAAVIDGDAKSAWAIDPQFGKDHAAVFEFEQPIGTDSGTTLTVTLKFENNDGHNVGRPRLSLTTAQGPVDPKGPGITQLAREALLISADKRSKEQQAALLAWFGTTDPERLNLSRAVQSHQALAPRPRLVKALISSEGLAAVRLHTQGEDFFPETHFLRRGDPDQKEGVARQGFLQVLTTGEEGARKWPANPPAGSRTSFRRHAFAEWLCDTESGAGHLLARVIVNRLWQHHMGRGLVATPSDFGVRGEAPSHPELLDWLANELIRNGWRLKPIHELIVTSAVYQQSSQPDEAKVKRDAENKLFWRRPSVRLEAEVIRDSLLAISGQLDETMYGPGTLDEKSKRRSIYFTVKRSKLVPMMVVFDSPEPLSGVGERPTTTIAPQALYLMNNPQVRGYARSLARKMAPGAGTPLEVAVTTGYLTALARAPRPEELTDSVEFVKKQQESYKGRPEARELALADFCQVLTCLNEFVYVD